MGRSWDWVQIARSGTAIGSVESQNRENIVRRPEEVGADEERRPLAIAVQARRRHWSRPGVQGAFYRIP